MADVKDILLDDQGELIFRNGDLFIGDSTQQHQDDIILSQKGHYKQNPYIGVGIQDFILDDASDEEIIATIQQQFELDGMKINDLKIDNGNIEIDANYE